MPGKISCVFEEKKFSDEDSLPSVEISKDSSPNQLAAPYNERHRPRKEHGEAIRLIKQGGVKVNDAIVTDPDIRLQQGEHIIKVGKRRFYKVIIK